MADEIRGFLEPLFSPEVELTWSGNWAGKRHYRGFDGVLRAYTEWLEPFSEYYAEALEFVEDGHHVAVLNRQWGSGRESGVPVEIEVAHLYEFKDGLITRLDEYDTRDEAMEAVAASTGTGG